MLRARGRTAGSGRASPQVSEDKTVSFVLLKITQARAGAALIVDRKGKLLGIFTDGDLRRHLERDPDLPRRAIKDVMTKGPLVVAEDTLAAEALHLMEERKIDELPVVDGKHRAVGLLDVQDLLRAGIV